MQNLIGREHYYLMGMMKVMVNKIRRSLHLSSRACVESGHSPRPSHTVHKTGHEAAIQTASALGSNCAEGLRSVRTSLQRRGFSKVIFFHDIQNTSMFDMKS